METVEGLSRAEQHNLVRAQVAARAIAGRTDPTSFISFVMKPEEVAKPVRGEGGTKEEVFFDERNPLDAVRVPPHQKVTVDFALNHRLSVIMLPADHAKCHAKGTPILMADGRTLPVEEIRIGDRVMGTAGPMEVWNVSSGRAPLYKVVPTKGNPFVGNEDHVLTLVHTETDEVVDVSIRDFLRWAPSRRKDHKVFHMPVEKFEGEKELPIDPYFLGVWFGDGRHSVKEGVTITNVDPEVLARLEGVASDHGLVVTQRDSQTVSLSWPGGRSGSRKRENPIMGKLRRLVGEGLSMEAVKTAPWGQRAAFLAGFIDADGTTRDNCVNVVQKRVDWADAVEFVARSLGIGVSRGTYSHPVYGPYVRLALYGEALAKVPIRIPRKKVSATKRRKNGLREGFRIEPIGEGDYFGFTIGGNGRYLLGDFTVTHNTTTMAMLGLYKLQQDVTLRGAIVSATQTQAEKVLRVVKDYIERSWRLKAVAPDLKPSTRTGDPWTQTTIVVERPPGIKDPSLVAFGMDGPIIGSRLDWIVVDDILTPENTLTQEQRQKVVKWFFTAVVSRLVKGGTLVVCNTAFHPEDLLHELRKRGFPTLRMDVLGNVYVYGDTEFGLEGQPGAEDLRDATPNDGPQLADEGSQPLRLVGNDHEPPGRRTLWPDRYDEQRVETDLRPNIQFNQLYMNMPRDDSQAMCKVEYVDRCKEVARSFGVYGFTGGGSHYRERRDAYTFTGVDLAVARGEENDYTSLFTFEVRTTGHRVILDIEYGRWAGKTIVEKIARKHKDYDSIVAVENNAAQDFLLQWALDQDVTLPIMPYTTGRSKAHPEYGIPGLFVQMANGAWAFPNQGGVCHPNMQRLIDDCLYYVPSAHTGDVLMSMFIAHEISKKFGLPEPPGAVRQGTGLTSR